MAPEPAHLLAGHLDAVVCGELERERIEQRLHGRGRYPAWSSFCGSCQTLPDFPHDERSTQLVSELAVAAHRPHRGAGVHRDGLLIGLGCRGTHCSCRSAAIVTRLGCRRRSETTRSPRGGRSLTFARKPAIHSLKVSRPGEFVSPPLTMTKSSTTNMSTAEGSCAFHTSFQNACTTSTEFMCTPTLYAVLTIRVRSLQSPPAPPPNSRHNRG